GERGAPTAGPATGSDIEPYGIAVDGDGNLYIADYDNCMVEKVSPTGTLSVVAGTGSLTRGVPTPGPATRSALYYPWGVGVDGAGNLYIADSANEVVEEVTMAAPTPSTVVIPSPSASASPSPAAAVPASTVPLVPLSALPLLVVVGVAILVLIGLLFLLLSPLQGQAPGTAVGPPAERAPPAVTPPSRFASWVGNATRVLLLLEACAIPFVAFFEYEGIWLGAVFAGIGLPTPVIAGPLAGLSLGGLLVACAVNLKRQRWAWIAALIVQMYLVLIGLLWRPVLILPTPCLVLLLLPGVRSAPARDARSADDRYPALPPWLESPPRVSAGPLPSGGPRRGARAWGIGCGATPVILAIVAWLLSTAYFNIHRPVFVGLEIGMLLAYPVTLALVVTVGRRRLRAMVRRLGLGVVAVAVLSCVAFLTSLAGLYALAFPHGLTVAEVEATPEYQLHYPGATPTGTTVQPYSPGVTSFDGPTVSYYDPPEATLSFQAPAPVTKVATWYSTRLASLGWSYAGCVAKASPWVDEYFTSGGDSMFELQISATYPQGSSITVDITLQQPIQGYLPQGLVVSCPSS
ncbi:MAG: SBBP repeat-containing protein, partial [Candidatus Dormibacteria bacterium]